MIAVDTNILVYSHRGDSQWHEAALACMTKLAEGRGRWAIPWPCLHEFLAIVTHSRIFNPPTPLLKALDQAEAWMESPRLTLIGETDGYWQQLRGSLEAGRVVDARVHDGRVAALCAHHGIEELWSADREFARFPGVTVRNPLVR